MQNAPAMLAQKMMNRQAPYGPVGMVSQNMSGNKKGAAAGPSGPVIGLKFDTTTATAGVTFSNSNTTVAGGSIASAKGNAGTAIGVNGSWYWEFIITSLTDFYIGVGPSTYTCNTANRVGILASTIAYYVGSGQIYGAGSLLVNTSAAAVGDVIGFKLDLTASTSTLTILKNNTALPGGSFSSTNWIPNYNTSWVPIWSSNGTSVSATIANNIYSYAGYTPIGTSVTTVAASASVPAVADGKYDVYTFNASGTFAPKSLPFFA